MSARGLSRVELVGLIDVIVHFIADLKNLLVGKIDMSNRSTIGQDDGAHSDLEQDHNDERGKVETHESTALKIAVSVGFKKLANSSFSITSPPRFFLNRANFCTKGASHV